MTIGSQYRTTRKEAVLLVCTFIILLTMIIDHQPRFFGYSVSYLSTNGTYIPPDRSWAFGFEVNWLLRATHRHLPYSVIQVALLPSIVAICSEFLVTSMHWQRTSFAIFAMLVYVDPLLNLYARFYMSDFLACLLFVALLACLNRALCASRSGFLLWLPVMAMPTTIAIFTRVAYALIVALTLVIAGAAAVRNR